MKRAPHDFDCLDLEQRVCPVIELGLQVLLGLHFPAPDYCVETQRYWRAETVREWVDLYARTYLASRPDVLRLHEARAQQKRMGLRLDAMESQRAAAQMLAAAWWSLILTT